MVYEKNAEVKVAFKTVGKVAIDLPKYEHRIVIERKKHF